jgi:hypothetical protein
MAHRPETNNEMRDANDPILGGTVKQADVGVDKNPDALTGEAGSHPVGAGLGAAAGGAIAGVGLGAAAGPLGAAVGAVVGGLAGGLAGKGIAEAIDPTAEDAYWRHEYPRREYYRAEVTYDDIQPAYRHGWEARSRYMDRSWDEVQEQVRREWESQRVERSSDRPADRPSDVVDRPIGTWEDAQRPIRDAWDRVDQRVRADRNPPAQGGSRS